MKLRLIICLLLIATPSAVLAAEYLTVVTSEVYRASGTQKEIATRASTCISQYLAAGTTDSQLIVSSDLDGGVIVARSALIFSDKLIQWKFRSTFTFEAREGRFRIEQTNLERFNDLGSVDKGDSQTRQYLIQGGFWGGCLDPGFDERRGIGLS